MVFIMTGRKGAENAFKDVDFIEAVHKARKRSTLLLEEQGIAILSIMLSSTLLDLIEHPEKMEKLV